MNISRCLCGNMPISECLFNDPRGAYIVVCEFCGISVIKREEIATIKTWNRIVSLMVLGRSIEDMPEDRFIGVYDSREFIVVNSAGEGMSGPCSTPIEALDEAEILYVPKRRTA